MPIITDYVLDLAIAEFNTNGDRVDILSSEPTDWAGVVANTLGNKLTPTISTPVDGNTSGRMATVSAFADGTVTSAGTATHWSVSDNGTRLLAAGPLAASLGVVLGPPFSLTEFDIEIQDPS